MSGDSGDGDLSGLQVKEEQHIIRHQAPPLQNFHRKEVRSGQHAPVCPEKISPRHGAAAFRGRSNAMTTKNVTHRLIRNRVPQVGQGTHDAVVAPARVFPGHPDDESF